MEDIAAAGGLQPKPSSQSPAWRTEGEGVPSSSTANITLLLERLIVQIKMEDSIFPIEFFWRRIDHASVAAIGTLYTMLFALAFEILVRRSPFFQKLNSMEFSNQTLS